MSDLAHNAGGEAQSAIEMLVKGDDKSGEQAMYDDLYNDSTMNGTLDKS